mmetsp:Transcript_1404/g.3113  ORF Transcript_1404/g.3113 Transcript_1404/m.3113 type:complete len:123 (-) Transcript_1404:1386-1754(-)
MIDDDDSHRRHLMFKLVQDGDLERLMRLSSSTASATAEKPRTVITDVRDEQGCTLLHHAAGRGSVPICQWLLEQSLLLEENADPSQGLTAAAIVEQFLYAKSRKHGRTALHWAARNGHDDCC